MAGGHPRESLEASFDVVNENASTGVIVEAETVMVACELISILPSQHLTLLGTTIAKTPLWYIRLNHTRLADAVLDLCGIPQKESLRQLCFQTLTRFTSAPPSALLRSLKAPSKLSHDNVSHMAKVVLILDEAVQNRGMPVAAATKFRDFVAACLPVHTDITSNIKSLKQAIARLRTLEHHGVEPRKMKRFEDAAKSLNSVKDLIDVLGSLDIGPTISIVGNEDKQVSRSRPLYISLDLGLRQRRKHYHGGTLYQCIVLPNDFFEKPPNFEEDHSSSSQCIKIAEGGNYSELVRMNRPPGNFATAFVNSYATAPIPVCAGVRFSVGKFVELIYLDAALSERRDSYSENWNANDVDKQGIDGLRRSLCHPVGYSKSVQCIVTGVRGLDEATKHERFKVAARLWSEGISAEYLPQSSVILSLVKRMGGDTIDDSGASDWSLIELYGVCALLRIPFVVVVQPHLLKDKGCVRLRQVQYDSSLSMQSASSSITDKSNNGEIIVSLDNLATTILGSTPPSNSTTTEDTPLVASGSSTIVRERASKRAVECIYIDNDHYFGNDRDVSKSETHQWKSYKKIMKTVVLAATSYLDSLSDSSHLASIGVPSTPVFCADNISFWVLRDFGTTLMRCERQEQSSVGASQEMISKYPKHKRTLKTLSMAIDNYMKRYGLWSTKASGGTGGELQREVSVGKTSLMTVLLYSKLDDRFDMISLNCNSGTSTQSNSRSNSSRRR
jgi:hypothetical protein